ncbi:MAG: MBL fold metallo-hydrolase [Mycobacterium sp.]
MDESGTKFSAGVQQRNATNETLRLSDSSEVPQDFTAGEVYFIGNATTLIQFAGYTILTDPAFLHKGHHVDLGHGIYARREVEPACQVSDLPPLDLIVLSHYHGDHFDDVAARDLNRATPIITTSHAVGQLAGLGFTEGLALDTWDSVTIAKGEARLVITAMPAKHSTDDALVPLLMPVNGNMLDFYRGEHRLFRLYITGDTMLHDRLRDIPRWYPDIDLGLIHAGGTTLFLTVVTMTGAQAVRAVEITKPRVAIPIHYNDFSVFMSGLDDFKQAADQSSAQTEFHYLSHGETYKFQPVT